MRKQTVVRQSLKDQIKSILIDRMIAGELAPGERIKELQVAEEFGTSQAPVREAIRCLETLGYVEHVPHVGAMVRTFEKSEIEEAYQVREALEVYAVSQITDGIDDLGQELDIRLRQMQKATETNDIRAFTEADNLFHRAIVACCNNQTMLSIWESLIKVQVQVVATMVEAAMPLDRIYALHAPIVEAFRNKDHAPASQLLKGHYQVVSGYWENAK